MKIKRDIHFWPEAANCLLTASGQIHIHSVGFILVWKTLAGAMYQIVLDLSAQCPSVMTSLPPEGRSIVPATRESALAVTVIPAIASMTSEPSRSVTKESPVAIQRL